MALPTKAKSEFYAPRFVAHARLLDDLSPSDGLQRMRPRLITQGKQRLRPRLRSQDPMKFPM